MSAAATGLVALPIECTCNSVMPQHKFPGLAGTRHVHHGANAPAKLTVQKFAGTVQSRPFGKCIMRAVQAALLAAVPLKARRLLLKAISALPQRQRRADQQSVTGGESPSGPGLGAFT